MGVLVGALLGGTSVLLVAVLYWAFFPDRAEKFAGQFVGLLARAFGGLNKTAVAMRVQGAINDARNELEKNGPANLLEEKVKVRWADTDEAEALLKQGEVLVVMQAAHHHEENVAHALMSYLPKALVPRARRYVEPERMRAVDLVMARAILAQEGMSPGALPVFFEEHFDPAMTGSESLETKVKEVDEIDLQGWLTRVLLAEYRALGDQLYPGEASDQCKLDTEELVRFVAAHARRELGDDSKSRILKVRHFRMAIIYVAMKLVVEKHGLDPYIKRAKRYLFRDKLDAVYLMAYDRNIDAVNEVADALEGHGWIASVERFTFPLRTDFKKRKDFNREQAITVCVRRRRVVDEEVDEELDENEDDALVIPEEIFTGAEPGAGRQPEGARISRALSHGHPDPLD